MRPFVLTAALLIPAIVTAQPPDAPSAVDRAKRVYEVLFTKPVRLSLESIAPGSGIPVGVGVKPKPWKSGSVIREVQARASFSQHKYWAVDGSFAFQGVDPNKPEWRIEPYARFRDMTRLNFYGLGNNTLESDRTTFAMLDRRTGAYGYIRPVGWIAIGARGEGFWPRTNAGKDPDVQSAEDQFALDQRPGFGDDTNYAYIGGFINVNYPYSRSEPPRRGGDYMVSLGTYQDVSDTAHSFRRFEVEGRERFPIFGVDRTLTLHGRVSSSTASTGHSVPFYLMDTLGGADNLRGFKESIIGGDEATSTLRSFESFRFRDHATALMQVDFRQRLWSQIFATFFVDAGVVAPTVDALSLGDMHHGIGLGVSVYRINALAVRVEFGLWGGEGRPHYLTSGRGLQF
jgi:hypothetical protein